MRIMAIGAFVVLDMRMIFCLQNLFLVMTFITKLLNRHDKEIPVIGHVRLVAGHAFSGFNRYM